MVLCRYTVVIEPDEDAFHAYVPALPGCHTFGQTIEEARANIAEAIALHVESMESVPEKGERSPNGGSLERKGRPNGIGTDDPDH